MWRLARRVPRRALCTTAKTPKTQHPPPHNTGAVPQNKPGPRPDVPRATLSYTRKLPILSLLEVVKILPPSSPDELLELRASQSNAMQMCMAEKPGTGMHAGYLMWTGFLSVGLGESEARRAMTTLQQTLDVTTSPGEDLDQRLHRLWSVGFTAAGLLEWDKALECFEKIGRHEDHPYALHALFASTLLYGRDGRHEDKRRVAERAATMLRRKLGSGYLEDPTYISMQLQLASAHLMLDGGVADAYRVVEQVQRVVGFAKRPVGRRVLLPIKALLEGELGRPREKAALLQFLLECQWENEGMPDPKFGLLFKLPTLLELASAAAEMLSLAGLCCEPADCPEQHDVARQNLEEAKLVMAQLQALVDQRAPPEPFQTVIAKALQSVYRPREVAAMVHVKLGENEAGRRLMEEDAKAGLGPTGLPTDLSSQRVMDAVLLEVMSATYWARPIVMGQRTLK